MPTKVKGRQSHRIIPHQWEDGRWYAHIYGRRCLFLHTVKFFDSKYEAIQAAKQWLKEIKVPA